MSFRMNLKVRSFARGAGKSMVVFPRAEATMAATSAAGYFLEAKSLISSASKKAELRSKRSANAVLAE